MNSLEHILELFRVFFQIYVLILVGGHDFRWDVLDSFCRHMVPSGRPGFIDRISRMFQIFTCHKAIQKKKSLAIL